MATRTATCACGNLRVTTEGEPQIVALCSCLQCQKRTGNVFSTHAFFSDEQVRIEGQFNLFQRSSDSGRLVTFRFCPECGSTVFWKAQGRPHSWGVAVGAFADPGFPTPQAAVWTENKPRWANFPDGIAQHARGVSPSGTAK
jgi:hypothetical protein